MPYALGDALGRLAAVDADSAVAFFLGVVEVTNIAFGGEHGSSHVGGLCFEFLHADYVGTVRLQPVKKAFAAG